MAGSKASKQTPNQGGRAPTAAQKRLAAQRALAAAAGRRDARRNRLLKVITPIIVVLVIVGVLVAVKVVGGSGAKSGQKATTASQQVIQDVTHVPAAALDAVGAGAIKTPPQPISGSALTADGKPRVLYVGAEYCPYCATERWAMVVALSRFGTFSNLGQTASSPSDVFPNTATLSFHGSSYSSSYLAFTGVEQRSNQVVNGSYAPLDTLSAADTAIMQRLDTQGSIPFVDIGGRYLIVGASYDPSVLAGKTHAQIASALSDPTSPIAKGVDGTANVVTAGLCKLTNGQPATVCTSAGVQAAAGKLG